MKELWESMVHIQTPWEVFLNLVVLAVLIVVLSPKAKWLSRGLLWLVIGGALSIPPFAYGLVIGDTALCYFHGGWIVVGGLALFARLNLKHWQATRIIRRNFHVGGTVRSQLSGQPLKVGTITSVDYEVEMAVVQYDDGTRMTVNLAEVRKTLEAGGQRTLDDGGTSQVNGL